jgi:hypothetical protein
MHSLYKITNTSAQKPKENVGLQSKYSKAG